MPIEKQLSVFMENKPGRLSRICNTLAEARVNIQSLSVHDTVDHAIVRMVVDNPTKALVLLEEEGLYIVTQDVVVLEIENKPGIIASIANKLFRADTNIEYAYCTATKNQEVGCLVLKTKDAEQTLEILEEMS
ncbi:MAG: ACT domain-containing protein [Candidatus Omnitrophica bacterium]|nr:ACT domain-containing protein [Candidatus Omnitrophota bacterium]